MQGPFLWDWGGDLGSPFDIMTPKSSTLFFIKDSLYLESSTLDGFLPTQRFNGSVGCTMSGLSIWATNSRSFLGWLFIKGCPPKLALQKAGLSNCLCPVCYHLEALKHNFWDCHFARSWWRLVQDSHSVLLHGQLHWRADLLRDSGSLVSSHLLGVWDCNQTSALFTIWKLHWKYVFSNEVTSVNSFCRPW